MDNPTSSVWMTLINSAHYIFLFGIIVLILVFVIRIIIVQLKGTNQEKSSVKSHQRLHKHSGGENHV